MAIYPWGCALRGFPAAAHVQHASRCGLARQKKFSFMHRTRNRTIKDSWMGNLYRPDQAKRFERTNGAETNEYKNTGNCRINQQPGFCMR
jgi:hypothetical protein